MSGSSCRARFGDRTGRVRRRPATTSPESRKCLVYLTVSVATSAPAQGVQYSDFPIFRRTNRSLMRRFAAVSRLFSCCAVLALPASAQQLRWPPIERSRQPAVRIGLSSINRPIPLQILPVPTADPFLRQSFSSWVNQWHAATSRCSRNSARRLWASAGSACRASARSKAIMPCAARRVAADTTPVVPGILSGRLAEYADIGMRVNGRGELGGAWTRFQPCDPGVQFSCLRPTCFRSSAGYAIRGAGRWHHLGSRARQRRLRSDPRVRRSQQHERLLPGPGR